MKNLIVKTKYVVVAILIAFNCSCSVEDGAQGPAGANGQQGPAGANGQQGLAGTNGADGADGTNGNANVQTLKFDAASFAGPEDQISIAEITQDVLDNDAILSYLTDDGNNWVTIPCPFDTYQFDFSVHVTTAVGTMDLDYGDATGNGFSITAGDLQELKVIIIESTTSTSGKSRNGKQQVYDELYNAGVDIKDYYAVCDYYGLEY